jgi:cysteinyl-tRNA synthetase
MHNNMVTINGQKMSKSLNNFITMDQLFNGTHEILERAYSPMTIRFFILQAHYRSTLDFSNEALLAAQKGYKKLINGLRIASELKYSGSLDSLKDKALNEEISKLCKACYEGMQDDLNTAVTIAALFNLLKKINQFYSQALDTARLEQNVFESMHNTFKDVAENILGLSEEKLTDPESLINAMLGIYKEAKENKRYDEVDKIRAYFKKSGLSIKDMKTGIDWAYEE